MKCDLEEIQFHFKANFLLSFWKLNSSLSQISIYVSKSKYHTNFFVWFTAAMMAYELVVKILNTFSSQINSRILWLFFTHIYARCNHKTLPYGTSLTVINIVIVVVSEVFKREGNGKHTCKTFVDMITFMIVKKSWWESNTRPKCYNKILKRTFKIWVYYE